MKVKSLGRCKKLMVQHPRTDGLRLKPRTRSAVTIWSLPEELLLHLLRGLHIKDLLNMRSTHSTFKDLIDSSSAVWINVSFADVWPSLPNIRHFEKAAEQGNIEGLIKLGIAYLYNEGLPGDFEGKKITSNGLKAANMFCKVESLTPRTPPFTWLFIRPPWATNGACCKECVFRSMKEYCHKNQDQSVAICIAKTLELLDSENNRSEVISYLQQAADKGSTEAAYLLWHLQLSQTPADRARELQSIRQLRDIASSSNLDAQLALCSAYAAGKYGGLSKEQAAVFMREFVQSSTPACVQDIFNFNAELTHSMRYILVDWLVEVAGMKDFSSLTLHVAISVVDRFLKLHKTTRSRLQLLGVSAMVLCSRFLGKDIITIREAAWLTDNTYKYEDVVRMMGEITATLRGNVRVMSSYDYAQIMGRLARNDLITQCYAEYICELAFLQSELSTYTQAQIACASILLARLVLKAENPWSSTMEEFTGFSLQDLAKYTFHVHRKCFMEGAVVDHRDVTLQAVKQRYADEKFCRVSELEMISQEALCSTFGATHISLLGSDLRFHYGSTRNLIKSPCRNKQKHDRMYKRDVNRKKASTPTLERQDLNDSAMSGYEGDKEDEEESFMEYLGNNEDPELVNLWCVNNGEKNPEHPAFSDLDYSSDSSSDNSSDLFSAMAADYQAEMRRAEPSNSTSQQHHQAVFSPLILKTGSQSGISVFVEGDKPSSSGSTNNQSGLLIFNDAEQSKNDNCTPVYSTRSQSRVAQNTDSNSNNCNTRPVLRSVSNTVPSGSNGNKPLKKSTKRKSTETLNSENKTFVMSF